MKDWLGVVTYDIDHSSKFPGSGLLQIRIVIWMYNVRKGEFAIRILLFNLFESINSSSWSAFLYEELMERLYDKRKTVI